MDIDDPRWGKEEEFVRSADGSETVVDDKEATIMNLIRENNRQHDRIKELEAIYIAAEAHVDRLRTALEDVAALYPNMCPDVVAIVRRALEQSARQED